MGIILPDYKYRDALKTANIDTLYDRRESLSITFDWLSHYILIIFNLVRGCEESMFSIRTGAVVHCKSQGQLSMNL